MCSPKKPTLVERFNLDGLKISCENFRPQFSVFFERLLKLICRDSEYISGAIRVGESDSEKRSLKESVSTDSKTRNSDRSSHFSNSADELSERVRKLLAQIDNSLEVKSFSGDREEVIEIPKLRGISNDTLPEKENHGYSNMTGTPRSIVSNGIEGRTIF